MNYNNIINSIDGKLCTRKTVAKTLGIPYNSVQRIYKRFLETGETVKKSRSIPNVSKLNGTAMELIKEEVKKNCTITLKELKVILLKR